MLGCREETMGKASSTREMGLKIWKLIRLMGHAGERGHLASREGCTHCGNITRVGRHMLGNPEPTATSRPTHLRRSRRAPNNFPL